MYLGHSLPLATSVLQVSACDRVQHARLLIQHCASAVLFFTIHSLCLFVGVNGTLVPLSIAMCFAVPYEVDEEPGFHLAQAGACDPANPDAASETQVSLRMLTSAAEKEEERNAEEVKRVFGKVRASTSALLTHHHDVCLLES